MSVFTVLCYISHITLTAVHLLALMPDVCLVQVHNEHQRRVREIDQVEKHLMMAKAAALAAEEKKLSSLDQQLGIPKGKYYHIVK